MIALLLCGLIAGACAAPQYGYGPPRRHPPFFPDYQMRTHQYMNDDIFDTGRFWGDLSKELRELDAMLADFSKTFPSSVSQEGVVGNEYKIIISLAGFEEKDIVVKAREGLLMIQANHKFNIGSERNYLDVRTLPNNVNVTGNWIFEAGVLKITFPLKAEATTPVPVETVTDNFDSSTRQPEFASREEIETNVNEDVKNVDIGLDRGDLGKNREIETNEIPDRNAVEATTYAVDLKDEVEFVPVKY